MATSKKSAKDPLSIDAIVGLLDTKLDVKFAAMESKLDNKLDAKFAALEGRLEGKLDSKLLSLERRITSKISDLEGVVKSLETKFQSQALEVQQHGNKITTLEQSICEKARTIEVLEKKIESTAKTLDQYKFKITDLENRSRRQNLRIIGIPEKVESGDLTEFFSKLLWEIFGGEGLKNEPVIDRAHRVARLSSVSDKPRAVIVRLHYPREKELLIRLARKKGMISYRNYSFRIVEDYSYEVMKARIAFKPVMAEIHSLGFKQALMYPAKLRMVLPDNSLHFFITPEEAKKFVEEYRSSSAT